MQRCRVRVLAPSMLTLLRTALFHGFKQAKNKKQNIAAPFDKIRNLGFVWLCYVFVGWQPWQSNQVPDLKEQLVLPGVSQPGRGIWNHRTGKSTIMVTGDHSVLANIFLLNSRNIALFFWNLLVIFKPILVFIQVLLCMLHAVDATHCSSSSSS